MFVIPTVARAKGSFARTPGRRRHSVALLLVIGVTGYLVEGLRIHVRRDAAAGRVAGRLLCGAMSQAGRHWTSRAAFDPFRDVVDRTAIFGPRLHRVDALHAAASFAGRTVNLAIRDQPLGSMRPVSLEEFEATGQIGVARLADFSRRQLVELDACVSCGRCEDSCPAFEAGKPLSPRNVVQDLVSAVNRGRHRRERAWRHDRGRDAVVVHDLRRCADVCPLGISPMRMITDMRRHLIGEGALRGSPAVALQKTDRAGIPGD